MIKDKKMDISYKYDLTTRKFTKGINKNRFILLHHTWGIAKLKNMANYLAKNKAQVSVHYIIDKAGNYARIGMDNYILWHAWSGRKIKGYENKLNNYAIGIEVISDGVTFTTEQIKALSKLVKELQKKHNIPTTRVIRHKDYSKRKWDIGDNFYKLLWCKNFEEWKIRELDDRLLPEDDTIKNYTVKELSDKIKTLEKLIWKIL